MVTLSFSIDKLLYKILKGLKYQSFRFKPEGDRVKPWKWEEVQTKFERREQVILNLAWKQRSPRDHLKIGDVPLTNIQPFDMHHLTEKDAIADGADSLEELEHFFQMTYGDGWRDKESMRIQWATIPNANLVRPNKTAIDWFDELYTVNPLIFPQGCPYECMYPCYARQMQVVRKLPGIVPGIYPGRLAGIQFAAKHIFIESMGDLFCPSVPSELIRYVIEQCNAYNVNKAQLYFLTKNPARYETFLTQFNPETTWLGTTIETDTYPNEDMSKAPPPSERAAAFALVDYPRKFVSIEPVMKFTDNLPKLIHQAGAQLVFIGANTGQAGLQEPGSKQVSDLVELLEGFNITVVRKANLARICEDQAAPSESPQARFMRVQAEIATQETQAKVSSLDRFFRRGG